MIAVKASRSPEPPPFAERFAYLRFLKHLELGYAPTNRDIGDAAGVTGEAVIGWVRRSAPPPAHDHVMALLRYFRIQDRERWFIAGEGDPPELALWKRWWEERNRRAHMRVAEPPPPRPTSPSGNRAPAPPLEMGESKTKEQIAAEEAARKRGGKGKRAS